MTDREQYKAVFSHLHASGDRVQEAKTMKKGHIRKGLAIGLAAALMATAAGAANAATDGRLFEEARIFFLGAWTNEEDGSKTVTGVDENGNEIHFSVTPGADAQHDGDTFYVTTTEGEDDVLATDSGDAVYQDEQSVTHPDGSTSTKSGAVTITPDGGAA